MISLHARWCLAAATAVLPLALVGCGGSTAYLARRESTEAALSRMRQARREQQAADLLEQQRLLQHWHPYTSVAEAYMAGDFSAVHDLEERAAIEYKSGINDDEIAFWHY